MNEPMFSIIENPDKVARSDILVGIPTYNEAESIANVVEVVDQGLSKYFPGKRTVIVNADNFSTDGTKDIFLGTSTIAPKIYVSTPYEVRGKGTNIRNIFRLATNLAPAATVSVDADLRSITPEWVHVLVQPILDGFDIVIPLYPRHKYDGSITNHLVRPVLRMLYGAEVEQPTGGEFGYSPKLISAFFSEHYSNDVISRFGVDLWVTTVAFVRGLRVCQAEMPSPKLHRFKESMALDSMFVDMATAVFSSMAEFESSWKATMPQNSIGVFQQYASQDHQLPTPEIDVDNLTQTLHKAFLSGFQPFCDTWATFLPNPLWNTLHCLEDATCQGFHLPVELWADIVLNAAIVFRNLSSDRERLMRSLVPLYNAQCLSYVNSISRASERDYVRYFEELNAVFQNKKRYLIGAWDAPDKCYPPCNVVSRASNRPFLE